MCLIQKENRVWKALLLNISFILMFLIFPGCFNLKGPTRSSANKLVLSDEKQEISVGESINLSASFPLHDEEEVEWSVSDSEIAFIESNDLSSLVVGLNEGSTTVKATSKTGGVATCTLIVKEGDFSPESITVDAVTLTFYDKNTSTYGITWHSKGKHIYPVVQLAEGEEVSDEELSEGMIFLAKEESFDALTHTDEKYVDYVYKATISGLSPDKVYTYRIGDRGANKWSDKAHIKTKGSNIEAFTFINITDSQETGRTYDDPVDSDTGEYSYNALKGAFSIYPEAELILHNGDMVEWSKYEESWTEMLNTNREYYMSIPTMLATGNHETSYRGSQKTFYRHYHVDTPQDGQSEDNGFYYSFDYANVHFTMVNTNDIDGHSLTSRQLDWLKDDLQSTNQQWKIVLMHNPLYSPAKWGSDPSRNRIAMALQNQLQHLFVQNNVDLVIQGHDHVYMDTYPIDGDGEILNNSQQQTVSDVSYWINPKGVIYHMSGIAGKSTNKKVSQANMDYYRSYSASKVSSFAGFRVEGDKLTIKTHHYDDGNNSLYGSYGIIKP